MTPYQPVMDGMLTDFMAEVGVSVAEMVTLRCADPFAIARVAPEEVRARILAADAPGIEAWVQVGTNLPFSALAGPLAAALGKPVIGVNAATYWNALRRVGVPEDVPSLGSSLSGLRP